MSGPHPQFSPACPIPYILHPAERVEQLKAFLQTDFGKAQRVNVEALIRLYENGELGPRQRGDPPIYLVEGRRVERNPWEDDSVPNNAMRWCETLEYQQMIQQQELQQMVQSRSETFPYSNTFHMHQLHAQIRLPPQYGGNEHLTRPFLVCNDTGSNVLTVFMSDLLALQFDMVLHGPAMQGATPINTANGQALQPLIFVDMQILTSAFVALTPWFRETAIVKPNSPTSQRKYGLQSDLLIVSHV